jgi:hypothetical protein
VHRSPGKGHRVRAETPRIVRAGPSSVKGAPTARRLLAQAQTLDPGASASPAGLTARARPKARPDKRTANLPPSIRTVDRKDPRSAYPIWHYVRMRWAGLVLDYIRALIWPVVIFALLIIFRAQVRTIMNRLAERIKDLKSIHMPGARFDFAEELLENRRDLVRISDTDKSVAGTKPQPGRPEEIQEGQSEETSAPNLNSHKPSAIEGPFYWLPLGEFDSPQTTIVAAWQRLESVIRHVSMMLNLEERPSTEPIINLATDVCSALTVRGVLNDPGSVLRVIARLFAMRQFVETTEVTKLEAYEYDASASETSQILLRAATGLPKTSADS